MICGVLMVFGLPEDIIKMRVSEFQVRVEVHEVDEIIRWVSVIDELVINDDQVLHLVVFIVAEQDVV